MIENTTSHTPARPEGTPGIERISESIAAPFDPMKATKEAHYRKLKQAYTALIKACIRILEEEGNGG